MLDRFVKFNGEVNGVVLIVIGRPYFCGLLDAVSFNGVVVYLVDGCIQDIIPVFGRDLQVNHHPAVFVLRIGISLKAATGGGREFSFNVVIGQPDCIVPQRSFFGSFIDCGTVGFRIFFDLSLIAYFRF